MPKSNAATVIDLDAFRQRKQQQHERSERSESLVGRAVAEPMPMTNFGAQPMFVPVWVCWVPAWGPIVG